LTSQANSMLFEMFAGQNVIENDFEGSYFIDRKGDLFGLILQWLRTGKVPIIEDEKQLLELLEEAKFFKLNELIDVLTHYQLVMTNNRFCMIFKPAQLLNFDLRQLSLVGAQLPSSHFRGCNMSGMDLSGIDLRKSILSNVNMSMSKLNYANLTDCLLLDSNLIGSNLSGANLSSANLSSANLSEANLSDANLSGANLSGAILNGANLLNSNLSGANVSDACFDKANLRGINLSGVNLQNRNFTGVDLSSSNLSNSNLCGANLSGANLNGTNMSGANVVNANFEGILNVTHLWDRNFCSSVITLSSNDRIAMKNSMGCSQYWNGAALGMFSSSFKLKVRNAGHNGNSKVGMASRNEFQPHLENKNRSGWYLYLKDGSVRSHQDERNRSYADPISDGSVIEVLYEKEKGQISFVIDGVNKGIAFSGIPSSPCLYPALDLLWDDSSFELIQ